MQQRGHAEEQAGRNGDHDGEEQYHWIESDLTGARNAIGIRGEYRTQRRDADDSPQRTSHQRENDPLGEKLTQQAPPPGAKSRPDGELALARLGAGKEKVRQVGTGDQEHEPDGPLQHPERRLDPADQIILQRIEPNSVLLRFRRVHSGIERTPLLQHRFDIRARLREGRAALQPSHQIQEVPATVAGARRIQRKRQPHLDALIMHIVPRRHDADDARGHPVDRDDAAQHRFVSPERGSPDLAG